MGGSNDAKARRQSRAQHVDPVRRLPHGYTNDARTDGRLVVKRYHGPAAGARLGREARALERLAGRYLVPRLVAADEEQLIMERITGTPGQELLERRPEETLFAVGAAARALQQIDPVIMGPDAGGAVIVHGDFGPQNVLLAEDAEDGAVSVTAVVDWEWLHLGDEVEDVAWAEWIVRTHHPHLVEALPALFDGFGALPPWTDRRAEMVTRCERMLDFVRTWHADGDGVGTWQRRIDATRGFRAGPTESGERG